MRCAGRLAVVVAAVIGVAAPRALVRAQQPVFTSLTERVNVPVSVRGGNQPVGGLTASDFELRDNGVKQSIEAFSIERLPIDVTLLLDVSRSVEGAPLERLKFSVGETAQLLRAEDRLRLIAVQSTLRLIFPFQPGGSRPQVDALTAAGGTALYDGIAAAMMGAAEPDRRQLIVAYTDGQDTISILSPAALQDVAGFSDAVVQLVVPTARAGTSRPDSVPGASMLNDLAARTGGQLFLIYAGRITDAFKQAIEDFRTSYVLRYAPTSVARGGWHEIDVKVISGTYEIRARKGYQG